MVDGRSRGDGDNRYRSESSIFLYAQRFIPFIIYRPRKPLVGLDFGPSFPVVQHSTLAFRVPSLASLDSAVRTATSELVCIRTSVFLIVLVDTFVCPEGLAVSCPIDCPI